jgi:crotonobetainyl-CoA:carnitine CoA-transferase CaiB-like acyl-CoA transferase
MVRAAPTVDDVTDCRYAPPTGPLAGIRVLDLSHIASGPFATMLMADMGADVIKIERPGTGDGSRQMDVSIHGHDSGYYLGLNKNKRSIELDLSTADGIGTVKALAEQADVFVENFRPGAAARLGIGYSDIATIQSSIIYCSITGFGEFGALRDAVAYDIVGQALSGIMSITGEPGHPPAKVGAPISDLSSGLFATIGILAALHHRHETGQGQHVGTSLLGASVSLVASYLTSHALGTQFSRVGSAHNTLAPYQAFVGSDEEPFILAAGNDKFFTKVTAVVALPDLMTDRRFETNKARTSNRELLADILQTRFATRSSAYWLSKLAEAGVPASPVRSIEELSDDQTLRANNYVTDVTHPSLGQLPVIVAPLTFSRTPVSVRRSPPGLNEHREEILAIARGDGEWITSDNGTTDVGFSSTADAFA